MMNPRERNNRMKHLFGNVDPEELAKHIPSPAPLADKRKVASGAVKSMDRAFVSIEQENERLREQMAHSESIIELDPQKIIPSFVKDRLDIESDPHFTDFVESIRENGQQLPILVRPLPDRPGFYQVAYGHRRLRACQIVGVNVKAIVRELSDTELIISQGVENTERANLSFIEQALFASTLKEKGFDRETIATALGRSESKGLAYISILTSTAALVPEDLVRKIGAAPSIGRPKWEKLGSFFIDRKLPAATGALVNDLVASGSWQSLTSDERFSALLSLLDRKPEAKNATEQVDLGHGLKVTAKRSASQTQISIPDGPVPGLAAWLLEKLPALVEEFRSHPEDKTMP